MKIDERESRSYVLHQLHGGGPTFLSEAREHSQNGQEDVVKVDDFCRRNVSKSPFAFIPIRAVNAGPVFYWTAQLIQKSSTGHAVEANEVTIATKQVQAHDGKYQE